LTLPLQIELLSHGKGLPLPAYQTDGAAGFDLAAAVDQHGVLIYPGKWKLIPTGICMAIPPGYEGQIRTRSGMALEGLVVLNSPGTIDSDYRGEVCVILHNCGPSGPGHHGKLIERGMRIAQMVISPVVRGDLEVVKLLPETPRGEGGFGHTGTGG